MREGGTALERLKVLFFLPGIGYGHLFEGLIRALLARGHEVVVALEHGSGDPARDEVKRFEELEAENPAFGYRRLPRRGDVWLTPARAVRRRLDYLRYIEPQPGDGTLPQGEPPAGPWGLRALLFLPPFRWSFGRRLVGGLLRRLEAGMPIPRSLRSFIDEEAPAVVLVSPLVEFGSVQGDYIRAAEVAGIPSVLVVASADDLRSKGGIRDVPTLTVVRNEHQLDEAVRLHGLPSEGIVAVGGESRNGFDASAAPGTVAAIERAAPAEVVPRREGRYLRRLLWLLTPLVAIVLPLLRPRATARAVVKAMRRLVARIRKWRRAGEHRRAERRKAAAHEAKEQRKAGTAAAQAQKKARAEVKEQKKARAAEARQRKQARVQAREGRKASTETSAEESGETSA